MKVLSYHPILKGDHRRILAGRDPGERDFELMRRAEAILLPQGCRESLYRAAVRHADHVFPDYRCRFDHPGKLGDIELFRRSGLPHPESLLFPSVAACPASFWDDLSYPVVLKSNHGGEGSLVFQLAGLHEARERIELLQSLEKSGFYGFVVQDWVPNDGRDLRVVIMGKRVYSYWRVQPNREVFHHNLAYGAHLDHSSDPELRRAGEAWARVFSRRTRVNLAGLDLLFPCPGGKLSDEPLFLEINYFFGRKGLGGSERYYELLQDAVTEWLRDRGFDHYPPPTGGNRATRSSP